MVSKENTPLHEEGISQIQLLIDRDYGLKIIEDAGLSKEELEKIIISYIPNGEPPIGSIKLATDHFFLYFSQITLIEGKKGCITYRIRKSSLNVLNDIVTNIFNVDLQYIPPWKYKIQYLKGLQYLLRTILTGGKVVILGNQLEIILFLLTISDVLDIVNGYNIDGIIFSESLSGIEKFHGVSSIHGYKREISFIENKCIVDLKNGECYGGPSIQILKSIEKLVRSNNVVEGLRILKTISNLIKSNQLNLEDLKTYSHSDISIAVES